ncbi:hypothetical protein F0L17_11505 [Streptomyces sp. TRM43335]|uniref:Uncharacterized protein n=2 Tax=Streptomyces taklimakanensis TaxID=2569853 RepID=A0A6G2BCD9_9ACTN|nr:hypothetical protein [Streptomyces taklimakanensis]
MRQSDPFEQDPVTVGLRFAEIVTGTTISDEPPAPESPLGRLEAFAEEHGSAALTPEHVRAAQEGRPLPPPA